MMLLEAFLQNHGTVSWLCFAFFLFLIYMLMNHKSSVFKLPPGPTPLPFIGNLHLLDLKRPYRSLMELSEKYGNIFTIQMGPKKAVVLIGYDTVKDALVNHADEFGERATIPIFTDIAKGNGIIFGHGESWKVMRRFALSTLRDFGMGKKTIEDKILEEVQYLVEEFMSHKGQPFDTQVIMNSAVANVICSVVFGDRFEYTDPTFLSLVHAINENIRLAGTPVIQLYNMYPRIGFLLGSCKQMIQNKDLLHAYLGSIFEKNRENIDKTDIRSFIDALIVKQQEESNNPNSYFHEENLLTSVSNLFAAGTETTSTTIRWGLLLMMKYPEIQKKVHDEIDNVIGAGRLLTIEDRKHVPFTNAVIHEIQRFANIVPMNIPHATTTDTHFRNYFVPKGMQVIPLLTSVLYDKTQWETPYDFNPSHFLDADGKFQKRDAFMPFSAGRRMCAGESLAKMELFLFFTVLLQKFTFRPPPGVTQSDLDLTPGVGFTLSPMPHLVCAIPRE
ncbi:cytochrome P450 2K1-like [Latimeria chalumnae]|uniref:cytochrome P450 2K1-like n=1 Tax=Latimeria chalumnae TaxID=7897 RepID=UPI00313D736A